MKKNDNLGVPKHIAIIMDGNGRWAKKRFLPKKAGHQAGALALEKIVSAAEEFGVKHLSVYAFSTENWKRPADEIEDLMNLLRNYLDKYIKDSQGKNVKFSVFGDKTRLDFDIQDKIKRLEEGSADRTGLNLHISINYGGRDEILRAAKALAQDVSSGQVQIDNIDEQIFDNYLDTKGVPAPDLLIRTSGEQRISNFFLWQLAYSELYFSPKLWPDFGARDLKKAIEKYQSTNRTFGGRK